MPYTEISEKEFEDALSAQGFDWKRISDPYSKEIPYMVEYKGIYVKVYSSIVGGVSRGVGSDAIRVIGWDPISNLPVMSSERRVNRTEGWRQNLISRIEDVRDKMQNIEKCKICGGILVERENKITHDKFMGCLNYRNHPKKDCKIDTIKKVDNESSSGTSGTIAGNSNINIEYNVGNNANKVVDEFKRKMGNFSDRLRINFQEIKGDEPLLETKLFKWGQYPFDKFNVIQSRVVQFVEQDTNVVIEAKTSTGKTIMGELFMWKVLKDGKKIIYTSPLKALTREKWDSWTKKFGEIGYKIAMVTGDYRLTDKRIRELNEANIILCTSEMLDHRTRNIASEKSEWLMKAGLLILDEVQMIGMQDRGDKLEAGVMRFTTINPHCKLILLSGTMPNSAEIASWINVLNGKETILIKSSWRPIKLNMKFEIYNDKEGYYAAKDSMMEKLMEEVEKHRQDKILIFVHSKADGKRILGILDEAGYSAQFHNADLEIEDRIAIEESFKSRSDESVRIIIATSTLAYGLNLPARIVIIAGMHRGIEEVSELDMIQMCGRSGRMGIDTEGDAIILLPSKEFERLKQKIENPGVIISQINNPLIAAFHVIGEIVGKSIKTKEDVYKWYARTLASKQNIEINKEYIDQIIDYLLKNNAIRDVNGQLAETELGKAAVYFYLKPDMLKDLMVNWTKVFDSKIENSDFIVSRALSKLRLYNEIIVSKAEKGYIEAYLKASKATSITFGEGSDGQSKIGQAYLNMIKGIKGVEIKEGKKEPNPLASIQRGLQQDIERIFQALAYIDAKYARWGKGSYWSGMGIRLKYGVGPELVELCSLEGIGGTYAKKLYDGGIRKPEDLLNKKKDSIMVLGAKYEGIIFKNKDMFITMGYKLEEKIPKIPIVEEPKIVSRTPIIIEKVEKPPIIAERTIEKPHIIAEGLDEKSIITEESVKKSPIKVDEKNKPVSVLGKTSPIKKNFGLMLVSQDEMK